MYRSIPCNYIIIMYNWLINLKWFFPPRNLSAAFVFYAKNSHFRNRYLWFFILRICFIFIIEKHGFFFCVNYYRHFSQVRSKINFFYISDVESLSIFTILSIPKAILCSSKSYHYQSPSELLGLEKKNFFCFQLADQFKKFINWLWLVNQKKKKNSQQRKR